MIPGSPEYNEKFNIGKSGCCCPTNSPWTNWHDIRCPLRGTPREKSVSYLSRENDYQSTGKVNNAVEALNPMGTKKRDHEAHVDFHQVTLDMKAEFKRAIAKHGFNRTPASVDQPSGVNLAVLVEEIGEVARAMTYDEGSMEDLISELIQVATMAAAWAVGVRASLQTEGV